MKYLAIALGLIIFGGAAFLFFGPDTLGPSEENTVDESSTEMEGGKAAESNFEGSIIDLANRGGSWRCAVVHTSGVGDSSGTVYVAGDRLRGDFTSRAQGMVLESHLIKKESFVYAWSPLTPTGYKIPVAAITGDGTTAPQGQFSSAQQAYSYNCQPWDVDESQFSVPDITFIDVN